MVSDKEKDLYIKSNIKDGKIPHKIDELFETQNMKSFIEFEK